MSGLFITFEGGEGAGKSTQITRLAERLRTVGVDVVTTREPGGTEGAEALRHVLLSGGERFADRDMEPVLFAAARADHVAALIAPALDAGRTVICDRFHDSTRVYQGTAEVDSDLIHALELATIGARTPDLTIILDIPPSIGLERARVRRGQDVPDRFEAEALAVHETRRRRFLEIAAQEPQRCVVVDGNRAPDEVAREIAFVVEDRLDSRRLERLEPNEAGGRQAPANG